MLLNPNCSEAIVRIRIDNLSDIEIESIMGLIKSWETNSDDWDCNSGTYYDRGNIFGIEYIEINGQFPYDNYDLVKEKLKKLPFYDKIEEDWEN